MEITITVVVLKSEYVADDAVLIKVPVSPVAVPVSIHDVVVNTVKVAPTATLVVPVMHTAS